VYEVVIVSEEPWRCKGDVPELRKTSLREEKQDSRGRSKFRLGRGKGPKKS
jgi:hypothetical protein